MSRRNKQLPLLEQVEITDAGAEGMSVARVDGLVVFVPFVVPGDVVDIQLYKKKRSYAEGRAVHFHRLSPLRVEPRCSHFGVCGGCKWQNMNYEAQLDAKQRQVRDNLERLGHVDCTGMRPICGSDRIFEYRNKLEFTFSSKRWLQPDEERRDDDPGDVGFHVPQVFDKVLPIQWCHLQPEPSNAIRNFLRNYALEHGIPFYDIRNHTGFLRNVIIRNTSTGEWMVVLIVAEDKPEWLLPMLEELNIHFPELSSTSHHPITSLMYMVNNKLNDSYSDLEPRLYSGQDYITEQMPRYNGGAPLRFRINPKSFYQTNSEQAFKLYSHVAEFADLQGDETVYDLYTGTGTIAQFVAGMCRKVVGIEYIEEAIADARLNASANGFSNCTFYAGDMANVLDDAFVTANGKPDVIITDPPRAGMHNKVVEQLLRIGARKIVYVSCNPATQARDLMLLSDRYDVRRIQPVDMFPHTQHVENVAELVRRD